MSLSFFANPVKTQLMRLSWNEIRARAAVFAEEWRGSHYERGETQTFYNEFFEIFGVKRRRVAAFEEPVKKLGDKRGYIDLFWKGKLLVEQKSAGHNLKPAKQQALDYFPGLKDSELPRYILLSDFQNFELYDLDEGTARPFRLEELPKYVEEFGFVMGVQKRAFRDQDPVNIEAAELMGALHDSLKASGYVGQDLERFLVRLLFCLFADDTGIFEPLYIFEDYIKERTSEDGSDVGTRLAHLFQVLNVPLARRPLTLDEDLKAFPYVNGELFAERLLMPSFNAAMRMQLIRACEFSWEKISPAIFGSLFQSILRKEERRQQGAHYTTEKNILKVIEPLFLYDLRAEFERLKSRRDTRRVQELKAFQEKLANLRFLDPACGCGNFLVIAYREIRQLEIETLIQLRGEDRSDLFDAASLAQVDVDQFYGIEINESGARISEVALWMMDHIMNNRLSAAFGKAYARIPLQKSPHIHCADALEIDWATVIAPQQCFYVLGNPPFVGSKFQTEFQRVQVQRIAGLGGSGGTLDYVAAWFLKAGEYLQNSKARIGFVATSSITQGEQVAQLWPKLFDLFKLEIAYGHRTFAWQSEARGKAHVHCVIVGLTRREYASAQKRLFSYPDINGDPVESAHAALTAYLFSATRPEVRHLVVKETSRPLHSEPPMIIGAKPIDGGYLIFDTESEWADFLANEPSAAPYVRPFIGSEEFINGGRRWILALQKVPPDVLRNMPRVMDRVKAVKQYRLGKLPPKRKTNGEPGKPGISSLALAETPTEFHVTVIPEQPFLVVPEVSSERREYVPIGWLQPPAIPSNLVRIVINSERWHFAVLTSAMHMSWLRHIGGRLESRYRYSIGLVYNTFPWPEMAEDAKAKLSALAQSVLNARALHPNATLADLYDPDAMPPSLRRAHRELDSAVDRLYRKEPFTSDRERAEHLFGLYEKITTGMLAALSEKKRRGAPRMS